MGRERIGHSVLKRPSRTGGAMRFDESRIVRVEEMGRDLSPPERRLRRSIREKLWKRYTIATSLGTVVVEVIRMTGFKRTRRSRSPINVAIQVTHDETGRMQTARVWGDEIREYVTLQPAPGKLYATLWNYKNDELWREILSAIFPEERVVFL